MPKSYQYLIPFYIFFLDYLSAADFGDSLSSLSPARNILLSCGSLGTINTSDDRTWIGDIDNPQLLKGNASVIVSPTQPSTSFTDKVYLTARLSHSQFTYIFSSVSAGQKFIRLYFYPTSYPNFDSSKDFFSVTAGSFTLLRNFSPSLIANAFGQNTCLKEFCVEIEQDLYYTPSNKPIKFVGLVQSFSIGKRRALETVYRINVGGAFIEPQNDTDMYRTWSGQSYLTDAKSVASYSSVDLSFAKIDKYTAPVILYQTAMSMGMDTKIKKNYNLTWEFPVDSGFTYLVRLHFCEFQEEITEVGDRVFEIYIANLTAETLADVISWSGGKGIPIYRDYAVNIGTKGYVKKQNLSIALHPAPERRTKDSDAILNGLEIFKLDNYGNLSGSNPEILITTPKSTKLPKNNSTISIISGVVSSLVLLSILSLFIYRRRRKAKASVSGAGISLGPFSSHKTKSSKTGGASQPSDSLCRHFSLAEIKAAVNNFDDILLIGVGGFGNVYKGWFIDNEATLVAIKRLNPGSQQGAIEFKTEIEMLSQLRHRHLVSLIGYCDDDGEMILVYDYMARGTLRDHLYNSDNPPLPWNQRLQICIGAARGLHYLHTGAKHIIIHRDVKTTNILLDEKWVAKVSDFGLSKIGASNFSQTHISTMVKGTFGYLDPDYFLLQQLTEKSDVYSFGVVLVEVLCARPPILRTEDRKRASLAVWTRECHTDGTLDHIVDPFLKGKVAPECLNQFAEVAISCLDEDRNRRPSMSEVVYGLEFALRLQNREEKDDKIDEADHIALYHLDKGKTPLESYAIDDSRLVFSNLDW